MSYKDDLRTRSWQKRAAEIKAKRGWRCQICHTDKDVPLEVHHMRYHEGFKPWEYHDGELLVVCDRCHEYEHFKDFARDLFDELKILRALKASLPDDMEALKPSEMWLLRWLVVGGGDKIREKVKPEWITHPIVRGLIEELTKPTMAVWNMDGLSEGLRMLRDRWIDRELKAVNAKLAEPIDAAAVAEIDKRKAELRKLKSDPL